MVGGVLAFDGLAMPPQPPVEADLPPLFHAADASSRDAQKWFLTATRIRLLSLLSASAFGLATWKFPAAPTDWAGILAAVSFGVAVLVEVYLLRAKPEGTWYEGRAVAESVKTLAWRYSVGAEPFNIGLSPEQEQEVDERFVVQLDGLLKVVSELDLEPLATAGEQISTAMRRSRALPLADRKSVYEQGRVVDQQNWYAKKARWNKQWALRWTTAMLVMEAAGVAAAIVKAAGVIEGDLLGFASAIVATIMAWLQTKQHSNLATAYTITGLELASVRSKISRQKTEGDWARFVSEAEEAFSREHTLWKASRGLRSM